MKIDTKHEKYAPLNLLRPLDFSCNISFKLHFLGVAHPEVETLSSSGKDTNEYYYQLHPKGSKVHKKLAITLS